MSQIIQKLDQQQLKSLCGIVAHTSEGLTKSELTTLLGQCRICSVDDGSSRNQLGYTIGLNKRDWLYNCLVAEINKSQSFSKVFSFLQAVLNPAAYTSADSRQKYRYLFEETNKVLLFAGLSIDQSGRLVAVSQAETLSEVDQRVNHLKKALYDRAIHSEVQKYCVEDYLRADYYDAVFEASKGLAERVRQISGLTTDGGTLFQTVFSKNDPYIFFNAMKTDSERSEFTGLKELLEAIFHLVRNPAAHTPKVNWKTDETKVLDILTLISFAQIRSLQNLMGRTARSGMYTEGSVIVTDPQLFDNKNNRRNGGNYKWKDCIKMFDSSAAEPCGSSILSLVQDIRIDYETRVIGAKVAQYIIDHYAETDCFGQCVSKLTAALHKAHPQKSANSIVESMMARKSIVEAIENHLCFVFSIGEDADKQAVAADICKGTLAYFMANDNEKALLERIFDVITSKISELEQSQIKNYARTMVGIKLSLQIEKWIAENHLTQQNYTDEQLVKMLISFFQETHTLKKEIDCFADICQMWLEGCSFVEMHQRTSLPIADLEDICSKFISYELSFFVGNVMDIIEINDEDLVNPLPNLLLLQRRLKYGVKTETAVSVCEKIFNDRFLANLLADEIGHDSIEANSIVGVIKSHKDDILDILSAYPTYFSERVQWICKD